MNLNDEHKVFLAVLDNCPLDCLAEPGKGIPSHEDQRKYLKREFNQLFYRLKKQGVSRFPYEDLPMDFRWNLCATRLRLGNFENWDGWEFRGNFATTFNRHTFPTPKWMGTPITQEGGLKVCGEQGIGDEILFMSAFPDLLVRLGPKALEVNCYDRLVPIFERSFRVKCVPRPSGLSEVSGQAMCLMGDLMRWYRRGGNFPRKPFLKPDPEKVAHWKEWLSGFPKPWTGIAWHSRHGSIAPRHFLSDGFCIHGTTFDLQYGQDSVCLRPPFDVRDDLENLFAFVAALDKVVTVTQTLVHVAGSVGTECHAIVPERGTGEVDNRLWYYGTGGPSPVYGSVTIYPSIHDYRRFQKS